MSELSYLRPAEQNQKNSIGRATPTFGTQDKGRLVDIKNDTFDLLCCMCETVVGHHTPKRPAVTIEETYDGPLAIRAEAAEAQCITCPFPHQKDPTKTPFTCLYGHKLGSITPEPELQIRRPYFSQRHLIIHKKIDEPYEEDLYVPLWSVLFKNTLTGCHYFFKNDGKCKNENSCKHLHASRNILHKCGLELQRETHRRSYGQGRHSFTPDPRTLDPTSSSPSSRSHNSVGSRGSHIYRSNTYIESDKISTPSQLTFRNQQSPSSGMSVAKNTDVSKNNLPLRASSSERIQHPKYVEPSRMNDDRIRYTFSFIKELGNKAEDSWKPVGLPSVHEFFDEKASPLLSEAREKPIPNKEKVDQERQGQIASRDGSINESYRRGRRLSITDQFDRLSLVGLSGTGKDGSSLASQNMFVKAEDPR